MRQWVTIQLSERGESVLEEEPITIEKILKKIFIGEYFLPLYFEHSKSYINRIYLIQGYVFVEFNEENKKSYFRLTNHPYFQGPLLDSHSKFRLLPDTDIKKMKKQLLRMSRPPINVGDQVLILDGKYKNLKAFVTEYYYKEKQVDLSIELKCMSIIAPKVPVACLKNLSHEEISKNSLQDKILNLLRENPEGLTRKQIVDYLNVAEPEKVRISTCLARFVPKKIIKATKNKQNRFIFTIK